MANTEIRPLRSTDWTTEVIGSGRYSNAAPLSGFQRRDGPRGSPLNPAAARGDFERELAGTFQAFKDAVPAVLAERRTVTMPYWPGQELPRPADYCFAAAPEPLTTTSISIVLAPNDPALAAEMGFFFQDRRLPLLRDRMAGQRFQGLVGNLGYYMTGALIEGKSWAHNTRFPEFPLPRLPSYLGYHLFRDRDSGQALGSFEGAHPAAVGVRLDGSVQILPGLEIDRYQVTFLGPERVGLEIDAISEARPGAGVTLYTPGFQGTKEIQGHMVAAEDSAGRDAGWQSCSPLLPVVAGGEWVHVFVANQGNGRVPVEKVAAVWEGSAPIPSFGAVLSFRKERFESLFESVERFESDYVGSRVQIVPLEAGFDAGAFAQVMGGFVPVVVDGQHGLGAASSVREVMQVLGRYGATLPLAQCGRETLNFDPRAREPAGLLVQTESRIGWILFDGRHELSVGASVVDVAALLKKLETEGLLRGKVQQAILIDGGSAMKAYRVRSDEDAVDLELLNRVAAGSRNRPGADPEGLNLYDTLKLDLAAWSRN